MTENSRKVLEFLQGNAENSDLTAKDVAEALGITVPAVTGSVNGLVKKGYAFREEAVVGTTEKGKDIVVKYIRLTEDGLSFDPDVASDE